MKDGNPEFSDIVFDFIKSRFPSASKYISVDEEMVMDGIEIFVDGRWVCSVIHDKVYAYNHTFNAGTFITPTDPQLFDKLVRICLYRR